MEKKLPTQGPDARMEKKLATQGPHADTGQIATYNRVCRSRGIEAINWQRFAPYPLIGSLPPSAFLRVFLYQAKFNCFTSQCVRYILFWWKHRNRVLCAAIIIVVRWSCGRLIDLFGLVITLRACRSLGCIGLSCGSAWRCILRASLHRRSTRWMSPSRNRCVCVCVCVCARARERGGWGERIWEGGLGVSASPHTVCMYILVVMGARHI